MHSMTLFPIHKHTHNSNNNNNKSKSQSIVQYWTDKIGHNLKGINI